MQLARIELQTDRFPRLNSYAGILLAGLLLDCELEFREREASVTQNISGAEPNGVFSGWRRIFDGHTLTVGSILLVT
ncbi:MAG: hypothetical protein EBQ98_03835 [Actinobacteria bacterium]|nr:hypothetical protein [Actinomycetota bacterium]